MKSEINKKTLREFGILVGLGFPLIFGFFIPLITGHTFRIFSIWVGLPLIILGFLKPFILFWPYKSWMTLGHILGWINSRIILGMVFILVLMPISLIMKLTGYDPLRKKSNNEVSYRELKKSNSTDLTKIF